MAAQMGRSSPSSSTEETCAPRHRFTDSFFQCRWCSKEALVSNGPSPCFSTHARLNRFQHVPHLVFHQCCAFIDRSIEVIYCGAHRDACVNLSGVFFQSRKKQLSHDGDLLMLSSRTGGGSVKETVVGTLRRKRSLPKASRSPTPQFKRNVTSKRQKQPKW